jgi:DHA2 family multidrug resistance protein-like MFS transporter
MGVPVMALTIAVVPRLVPESRADVPSPLDLPSAGLSLVSVLSLVFALKRAVASGVDSPVLVAAAAGLVLGAVFLRRQAVLTHPLLDLGLLARPRVRRTLTALFLTALLMGGTSLFFNLYLQEVQGLSPLAAAWWMLPMMVSMIGAANLGPLLNRRLPQRTVVVSMMSLMAIGFALYAVAPASAAGRPVVALGGSLATFGIGAAFPMLMDGVISAAPPERAASSASLAQLSNELGIAMGLTVLGSLGTVVYRWQLGLPGSTAEQSVIDGIRAGRHDPALLSSVKSSFTDAFHVTGLVGVVLMVVVLILASRATRETPAAAVEDLPALEEYAA